MSKTVNINHNNRGPKRPYEPKIYYVVSDYGPYSHNESRTHYIPRFSGSYNDCSKYVRNNSGRIVTDLKIPY